MDRYAEQLIARGPTLAVDGSPTDSVHILSLPDAPSPGGFAFDEPNYQVGAYRDGILRRWRNMLGRSMWESPGGQTGGNRHLVLGLGPEQGAGPVLPRANRFAGSGSGALTVGGAGGQAWVPQSGVAVGRPMHHRRR